ncbi:MAG: CoA transferase [Alphaproteobacteria bacterium]|nr:CoA transferase [Alphaproteobacteria bacterium]
MTQPPLGALAGVRVLDLSRLVAGNALTGHLADHGADVVKIEDPGQGDDLRAWRCQGVATYWKQYSRNKRSLSLDLRRSEGKALLLRLVDHAAVLVENFRPGTLEKWGLGPSVLWQRNPKLIIVRISGWGQTGPYREKPGFGSLVEAMSGFAAMNGFEDRPPVLPPLPLADQVAGITGATAVLAALRHVEVQGGAGQELDLALFDPLLAILGPLAANHRLTGTVEPRCGSRIGTTAPRNVYRTQDGGWVALSASMQSMVDKLFDTIGQPELKTDPRFATNAGRVHHVEALDALLQQWIGQRSTADNLARFDAAGVTVGPVCSIADLIDHPFITGRGVLVDVPDPELGTLPMPAVPVRLSATPGTIRRPAPALGQDTTSVLSEAGLSDTEIARLIADGVVTSAG